MARRILCKIFMISLFIWPMQAEGGRLTASARLVYSDYEIQSDNVQLESSAFQQTYGLAYTTGGVFLGGRVGSYSLMLGGSLGAFNSEVRGSDRSDSSGKFLYSGDILIAPGGLPFRLHAYCRDTSGVATEYATPIMTGSTSAGSVPWGMHSSSDRLTGFTFLAGIQNGRYRGIYRDMLSMFPRLLIDYEERILEDKESVTPTYTRDRNLAFVSLNKKKNWFHYRFHDHKDFLNPMDDDNNKEVILGTIDHLMRREWIYLTNWIMISVDGKIARDERIQNNQETISHNINMYGILLRSRYRFQGGLNYERNRTLSDVSASLSKSIVVPLYASGVIDRNTDWHVTLESSLSKQDIILPSASKESDKGFSILTKINTNKLRPFRFDSRVHLSASEEDHEEVLGATPDQNMRQVNIALEAYSNVRYQKPDFFKVTLNMSASENEIETSSNGSWNTQLSFNWNRNQSTGASIALSQSLSYAKSDNGTRTASTTSFFKAFRPTAKLKNSISAKYKASSDTEDDQKVRTFTADHDLRYKNRRKMQIEAKTFISITNLYNNIPNPFSINHTRYSYGKQYLQHSTSLKYEMSRQLTATGSLALIHARQLQKGSDFTVYSLSQGMHYSWYTSNGIIRKLADLNEALTYESGPRVWMRSFNLSCGYYPTKILYMKTILGYQENSDGADSFRVYLATGFNWPKLKIGLTYDYTDSTSAADIETTNRVVRLTLEKVI